MCLKKHLGKLSVIAILWLCNLNGYGQKNESFFQIKLQNQSEKKIDMIMRDSIFPISAGQHRIFKQKLPVDRFPFYIRFYIGEKNGPTEYIKELRILQPTPSNRKLVISSLHKFQFNSNKEEELYDSQFSGLSNIKDQLIAIDRLLESKPGSIAVADMLYLTICNNSFSTEDIRSRFDKLSDDVKTSSFGKRILNYLKARENFTVGKKVDNFELTNNFGKKIDLYSIKSEYVLLDFWFSRCGPCIESFPEMIDFYKKSDRSKIEILGISVDPEQLKPLWKSSIEKNNLPWLNVIDPGHSIPWYTFSVMIYPTTILIDKNHTIVSINPTIDYLDNKIK